MCCIFPEHHFFRRHLKCCFCQIRNFSKALIEIPAAIDRCIKPMAVKTKYTPSWTMKRERISKGENNDNNNSKNKNNNNNNNNNRSYVKIKT